MTHATPHTTNHPRRAHPAVVRAALRSRVRFTKQPQSIDPAGNITDYGYDARGNLILCTPKEKIMKSCMAICHVVLRVLMLGAFIFSSAVAQAEQFTFAPLGIGEEDTNFKSYRPSYFGLRVSDTNKDNIGEVKFQLSLKYQITKHDVVSDMAFFNPALSNWYFGYTQKSFWSIQRTSAPFREINFSPEFFKEIHFSDDNEDGFKFLRFGLYQHESTGEAGVGSHGWNTTYLEPVFKYGEVTLAPKVWVPAFFLAKKHTAPDNPDIFEYLGYTDIKAFYEPNKSWHHSLSYRQGKVAKRFGVQWQTEYALSSSNAKVFMQYWAGYGESLKDYNVKTNGLVVGFSTVWK